MDRQLLSEYPIHRLIPDRRTPELSYLCAKHGAAHPYRVAADIVSEITGLRRPCHMTVRRDTLRCGQQLEDAQFLAGWYAGQRRQRGRAQQLRVAIDGTYLSAAPGEEVTKFEVVAGRVERDGGMGLCPASALHDANVGGRCPGAERLGATNRNQGDERRRQGYAFPGRIRRANAEQTHARLVSSGDEDSCCQDSAAGLHDDTESASRIHGVQRANGQSDSRFALARTLGGSP